jgi:hypothetical protein
MAVIELDVYGLGTGSEDVERAVVRAREMAAVAIAVAPGDVALAARLTRGTGLGVVAVAGYPGSAYKPAVRAIECSSAVKDGAACVDVCGRRSLLLAGDLAGMRDELTECARAARAASPDTVLRGIIPEGVEPGPAALNALALAAAHSGFDALVIWHPRLVPTDAAGLTLKLAMQGSVVEGFARVGLRAG